MKTRSLTVLAFALTSLAACGPDSDTCSASPGTICTYAGTNVAGLSEDGLPPLRTEFYLPQDLAFSDEGIPHILDWNNHRVRIIDEGKVETIIGTGELGDAPDGVATQTKLNHPSHVSFAPDGTVVVSAWHNSKILRYDPRTETVETICGTGGRSFNGDGMDALETILDLPVATGFGPDGTLYISDQANQRIRSLDTDNRVRTVAGTGEPGYSGDGGPAVDAQINLPVSQSAPPAGRMAIDADGNIYLADTLNQVVRKVDTEGIIHTVAGSGDIGLNDADIALEAKLDTPSDVAVDAEGNLYIADTMNNCVRRVDPEGSIATVAGVCGEGGFAGNGGPASAALLDRPYGIALDANGNLYVADTHNHILRVIYAPF